jgi:hypothetical protein
MANSRTERYKARFIPRELRLPLNPLLTALHLTDPIQLRPILQCNTESIEVWAKQGLRLLTADRIAVKYCGQHPAEIWGLDEWGRGIL